MRVVGELDEGDAARFGGIVALREEADGGGLEGGEVGLDVSCCGAEWKVACVGKEGEG